MDGIHDFGGKQGYGPIDVDEPDEPFHYPWEARLFGITRAYTRPVPYSIDRFRFFRECIEPDEYLNRRYYDQWLEAHVAMMVAAGAMTVDEFATGKSARPLPGMKPPMPPERVPALTHGMDRYDRDTGARPAFAPGDLVTTIAFGSRGHTRLPQYARGRTGRIEYFRGIHVLPDSNVDGKGWAEPLYTASFLSADLWPEAAGRKDRVYLDLWESYFERG